MRHSSPTSAGATYLDKARRIDDLRQAARRAQARMPSIQRMILFGSLASGTPTPRSDGDILAVVDASSDRESRDRLPDLLRAMSPLPCPVDLRVLTEDELQRGQQEADPLVREALAHGIDLLSSAEHD
jgi:predicted nucleotidyltransferase